MPVPVPPYSSGNASAKTSFWRISSTAYQGNSAAVVDLGRPRRDVLAGERAHGVHQHPAVVGERVQLAGVSHA